MTRHTTTLVAGFTAFLAILVPIIAAAPQPNDAAQLKAAQEERIKIFEVLLKSVTSRYKAGILSYAELYPAQRELCNAKLDATDDPDKRIAVLTQLLEAAGDQLKHQQNNVSRGIGNNEENTFRANAEYLRIKIQLLRERAKSKAMATQSAEVASGISWGDWCAGWSMRLCATKATWTHDELPEFTIDLRKRETGEPDAVQQTLHNWLLDVDGRRFRLAIFTTSREHKQVFEPGVARQGFLTFRFHRDESGLDIQTGEGGTWINSYRLEPVGKDGQVLSHPKPDEYFQWTPGKHLVRVAL